MRQPTRPRSGRPQEGEFAGYAKSDIDQVAGDDAVEILTAQEQGTLALFKPLREAKIAGLTYAPGKWTLKEIVGHLADDERIFGYRALRVARGDATPLPGFDERIYVASGGFEARTLAALLAEYRTVRRASISLFRGLPREAWLRRGTVNEYSATVRGLAFHVAGHELHHLRILRDKYLPLLE